MKRVLSILLATVLACSMFAAFAATASAAPQILVTSEASIEVAPDIAVANFGVTTNDASATKARQENTASMNDVIAALTKLGISKDKIQTSYVGMYPSYDYSSSTSKITGYEVNNSISVTIDDLDKVAEIVNTAMQSGANTLQGVTFDVKNRDDHYVKALEKATSKAPAKAKALAKASGLELGAIVSVAEGSNYNFPLYASVSLSGGGEMAKDAGNIGDTIQAGMITISASVTVTYNAK